MIMNIQWSLYFNLVNIYFIKIYNKNYS
jgi:hypothetical protein